MKWLLAKISAISIILLAFSVSVKSQPWSSPWSHRLKAEGYGGLTIGALNTNLGELNRAMNAAGYGSFDNTQPFLGGMAYGIINNRVMLGGWGAVSDQTSESQFNKSNLNYVVGFFNAGYVVMSTKAYKYIPFMGVGGGGYTLHLYPIDQGSPEFHNVLADPRRTTAMNAGYAAVELGLSNHFSFNIFDRLEDDNINTFKMGGNLRVGAFYPMARSDWKFEDEGAVFKGPAIASKPVFYASLTLLFGASTTKAPIDKADKAVKSGQPEIPQPTPEQQKQ